KSAYGMTVRDKGHSNLSQSVDSRKMVLNLAGSQKYIKYTWFLTITANQSKHPGLAHLHEWKNSMKWAEIIPNYESLSSSERLEIKQAVEEAYGVQVFSAWGAVKYMFLRYLKTQCTRLKTNTAIFARDEYQKDTGNLCHNHLIFAVDTSTMNGDTEKFIQDLIRTSVMDIVKSEDVERMLANGLLKSVDEVAEVHDLANVILRHNCDDRCKIRVGPGESENDFRCRKLHAVRDSTDCTTQSYITIPHEYKESTLEVLEDMGLFVPASDEDTMDGTGKTKGTFNHPYFVPKRHLAPCVNSATCNMSPVIADFFVAFKSMQNAQALDHTNGIAKYVCKYIAKFDEGNYVVLCQDIHTGQWVLGKTHLHNTKVVRSKINEDKAFDKERYKNHPKGRDMPHFEIRQIMMGDPEVFTDLDFIQVSTLPFELRPTNSIVLDSKGNIVNNNRANDDDDYPDEDD
ncbi:hypothetical protein N9140_00205, partial [bacterium]|nr:hypothetical protein [bacterium]